MSDLFAPPVDEWRRVSVSLRSMKRLLVVLTALGATALLVAVDQVFLGWWWLSAALLLAGVGGGVWGWLWAARSQHAWGYAENAEDLYVVSGVMWRRLVAVPYGRMQYVDVTAGPLERLFKISRVTLHTASTQTSAHIPGLPADEAARLRDRLTEVGEARRAGV